MKSEKTKNQPCSRSCTTGQKQPSNRFEFARSLQGESVADEAAAQDAFKQGQNRVDAMAMIHRYLYSTDEVTTLVVKSYFTQLVQSIAYSYGYTKDDMELSFDVTEQPINVDLAIPLGLIANELVSNAF